MATGHLKLTPQELAAFDGSDPGKPLYIAVRGAVYDVSAGREFYGPGKLLTSPHMLSRHGMLQTTNSSNVIFAVYRFAGLMFLSDNGNRHGCRSDQEIGACMLVCTCGVTLTSNMCITLSWLCVRFSSTTEA